jgi:hypothetical protein
MLIMSRKHQEKKLPQIQADSTIKVQLQKGRRMKNESREGGTHRSLAGDGGAAAVSVQRKIQSPCNAAGRRGGGGVVDEDAGRRRSKVPEWRGSSAAKLLCPSVRRRSAGGRGAEEEEGTVGVKERVTPTPRIYTEEARVVEIVGSVPLPDRFCGASPRRGAEWCGGYHNHATWP